MPESLNCAATCANNISTRTQLKSFYLGNWEFENCLSHIINTDKHIVYIRIKGTVSVISSDPPFKKGACMIHNTLEVRNPSGVFSVCQFWF